MLPDFRRERLNYFNLEGTKRGKGICCILLLYSKFRLFGPRGSYHENLGMSCYCCFSFHIAYRDRISISEGYIFKDFLLKPTEFMLQKTTSVEVVDDMCWCETVMHGNSVFGTHCWLSKLLETPVSLWVW